MLDSFTLLICFISVYLIDVTGCPPLIPLTVGGLHHVSPCVQPVGGGVQPTLHHLHAAAVLAVLVLREPHGLGTIVTVAVVVKELVCDSRFPLLS